MKVLLSFVGYQDPISEKTNELGAVLTLCQHLRPEIVYLLPSAEGPGVRSATEPNARMTKEFLEKEILPGSACYIRPLTLGDPTSFEELLPRVKEAVAGILAELNRCGADYEIHLNCSSGTPQMTACWYVLANSGYLPAPRLWQAHNPQMVAGPERVREMRLDFLEEENIVARLRRCLPEYLFGVMAAECERLKEISVYSRRRSLAELAGRVFKAYSLWDLLHYREAYERLAAVEREWHKTVDAGEAAAVLKAQVDYLEQLKPEGERESPANLVDIYYSAERCFARGAYADALARFWRIYEGAVYYWLRERWGVEPQDLSKSRDAGNREKILQALEGRAGQRGALSLSLASEILYRVLGDKVFGRVGEVPVRARRAASWQEMKLSDLLEELREKRNSSVVAHGMRPVSKEDAANSLAAARVLLSRILPGGEDFLASYPLQQAHVSKLVDLLAAG